MLALVTGIAGFIESNLADRLLAERWHAQRVDCFALLHHRALETANLHKVLTHDGCDVVLRQAAQHGARLSWADGFTISRLWAILRTRALDTRDSTLQVLWS